MVISRITPDKLDIKGNILFFEGPIFYHLTPPPLKDFNGDNALMIACKYKNIQAFNTYLQHCPSAIQIGNKQGDTPIISATKNGLRSLVVSLLDLGCDVNSMDQQGSTLLHQ